MPRRDNATGGNADPHRDGEFEGVLNDSTATAGGQMGVQAGSEQKVNPLHTDGARSPGLEKFERFTRGERTKEEEFDK